MKCRGVVLLAVALSTVCSTALSWVTGQVSWANADWEARHLVISSPEHAPHAPAPVLGLDRVPANVQAAIDGSEGIEVLEDRRDVVTAAPEAIRETALERHRASLFDQTTKVRRAGDRAARNEQVPAKRPADRPTSTPIVPAPVPDFVPVPDHVHEHVNHVRDHVPDPVREHVNHVREHVRDRVAVRARGNAGDHGQGGVGRPQHAADGSDGHTGGGDRRGNRSGRAPGSDGVRAHPLDVPRRVAALVPTSARPGADAVPKELPPGLAKVEERLEDIVGLQGLSPAEIADVIDGTHPAGVGAGLQTS